MREILFRAKAINRIPGREYRTKYKNGDWVYGLLEKPRYPEFSELPAEMRNTDGVSGIEVDFDTIGQYTGLKDKKGRRIFEGDIVGVDNALVKGTFRVEYGNSASFICVDNEDRRYFLGGCNCKVIGNIYDNPELLGGDDNA